MSFVIIYPMKQFWLTFREIAEVVVISLFTVFIIRNYLMQPFLVSGASMNHFKAAIIC